MGLSEVSSILWRERQLLELLLFKLEEEQLLLAAGRTRWLSHAAREVDRVLEQLKKGEVARAIEVEAVAAELGIGPGPTLHQLVEAAPAPWDGIFADHRQAFGAVTQEITALAELNRDLLNRGYLATRDALAWLGESKPEIYSPTGVTSEPSSTLRLVDQAM